MAYAEVDPKEGMIAAWILGACVALALATLPLTRPTGVAPLSVVPTVMAVAAFAQLLTAFLLYNQYRGSHYPPLAVLALAYGGTGVLGIAYVISFSLLSADFVHPAAGRVPWLYFAMHFYFAAYVLLFVVWEKLCRRFASFGGGVGLATATALAAASIAFVTTVLLRQHGAVYLAGDSVIRIERNVVGPALLAFELIVCAFALFAARRRRTVHLWLGVVVAMSFCALLLAWATLGEKSAAAAYAGRIEWLASAATLAVALLAGLYKIVLTLTSSNATLYEQSVSDELTGLLNRRGFNGRIEEELRRTQRKAESLALLLVDIDDFKRYNDGFGHPAGDAALYAVARVIRGSLRRAADVGCRIGGEEFAVLLPETDDQGAIDVAERIRHGVERLGIMQGADARHRVLTVSVGVASTSRHPGSDALELTRRADRGLYAAKNAGRDAVRFQGVMGTRNEPVAL
jgi:diguanylate cyclase (GGDEF)-like protein